MKKIAVVIIGILFCCVTAITSFAASEGVITVKPEIGRIEGGQKGSVRIIYNGSGVEGLFAELSYPSDMITAPVMTESVSGVQCEVSEGTVRIIYLDSGTPLGENGELRICKLDFEVKDEATVGSSVRFEIKTASGTVAVNDLSSTVELEKKSEPFVVLSSSDGNRLSAVEIMGGTITPEFSPYVRNYQVVVPSSIGSVTIEAVAQNPEAVVDGIGTMSLYSRERKITVTNPDGESFEYNFTFFVEDYRGYTSSKIWKFISNYGFYMVGIAVIIFASWSVALLIKQRRGESK